RTPGRRSHAAYGGRCAAVQGHVEGTGAAATWLPRRRGRRGRRGPSACAGPARSPARWDGARPRGADGPPAEPFHGLLVTCAWPRIRLPACGRSSEAVVRLPARSALGQAARAKALPPSLNAGRALRLDAVAHAARVARGAEGALDAAGAR